MIVALKEQGTTVFLTTHYIEGARAHLYRIAFIAMEKLSLPEQRLNLWIVFLMPILFGLLQVNPPKILLLNLKYFKGSKVAVQGDNF